MWWHISESIWTTVHLSPCAQLQPQDCWSSSAQNWFPATYFIRCIFLLYLTTESSAQPQPHQLSETYWCSVGAVCVLLWCSDPPPTHTHTPTHRPFVGSLPVFCYHILTVEQKNTAKQLDMLRYFYLSRFYPQICFQSDIFSWDSSDVLQMRTLLCNISFAYQGKWLTLFLQGPSKANQICLLCEC